MFSISRVQRKIFYLLLGVVWFSTGFYAMFHDSFLNGLKIMAFGSAFMLIVFAIQTYVIKMIQLYDSNLQKQHKNLKKKKMK
ncbi:conserved hypothetical protein [Thermoanaerobacter italicus Ab9]|uniref:Uncharacterized protein n=1 Tax=Thermoanaerobacter italicus (strain DSM 9252 / Ab9) TaxID=580331 RepID=D3T7F3_THEIA|nr:hypothetical protein [Thermoanaerobacter italicus]ADD01885.1 conserved hypothetical protein [Thermoanaerobacter italicus Ab9]